MPIREGPPGPEATGAASTRRKEKVASALQAHHRDAADLEALNARLDAAIEDKAAAEAAQAQADAHFRAGFESDAVGQAHYDPVTGRVIRVNRAHARMLGYEPEEMVGRISSEFTWPEDKSRDPY